jgi:hypothetical protein
MIMIGKIRASLWAIVLWPLVALVPDVRTFCVLTRPAVACRDPHLRSPKQFVEKIFRRISATTKK